MKSRQRLSKILVLSSLLVSANQPVSAKQSVNLASNNDTSVRDTIPAITGAESFVIESGMLLFPGTVNHRACRLSIDTGSAIAIIDEAFAKELKLRLNKQSTGFPRSILREVRAGSTTFQNVAVQIVRNKLPKRVLLLGTNLLQRSAVSIDFQKDKIVFGNSAKDGSDGTQIASDVSSAPSVSAFVGNANCLFLVDLCSPFNTLSAQRLDELKSADPGLAASIHEMPYWHPVVLLTGEEEEARLVMVPLKTHDLQMDVAMHVYRKSRGNPAILGLNFFRQFSYLKLDFPAHKLIIGPKLEADDL